MPDFLLELLTEEIPARMQAAAAEALGQRFTGMLAEAGLAAGRVRAFATPRRLALLAEGLPATSAATLEERRGPRADAPESAIAGFLKAAGVARAELEERETGKGRFLFATIRRPGRPAREALAAHLPRMIAGLGWPKSMRWEASGFRWVRPLRGIVALLDREVVPFELAGLEAGRKTFGHRFMGGAEPVAIREPGSYAAQLTSVFVILDPAERATRIREGAARAAEAAGLVLEADEALALENAGLTEWPVPLLGRFDPAFLAVPEEILRLTMKAHQRDFACRGADGRLAPAFVCVANLEAPDGGRTIVSGNERVLAARLADARFFWEQDVKVPLEAQAAKLVGVLFHERLGTMAEKVERVARLARWLVETWPSQFPGASPDLVERAARLARADLVTGTVGEFPELQGIIGARIAEAQGEAPEIVSALRQHYAPVPEGAVPVAVALADRADTLARFFAAGLRPSGSGDPFALRRAALGLVDPLLAAGLRVPLRALFGAARAADADELVAFLAERLKVRAREAGVPADQVDAVFALGEDDLVRVLARVKALQAFLATEDGSNLLAAFRRAANILKAEGKKDGPHDGPVAPGLLAEPAERDLASALAAAQAAVTAAVGAEDFTAAMQVLASLRPRVDRFFETVTVNAAEAAVRRNRLALLSLLVATAGLVADFAKLEG
ncbi:glycine--tRNA ligase subunit beta [Thermaurantiacus sp.]